MTHRAHQLVLTSVATSVVWAGYVTGMAETAQRGNVDGSPRFETVRLWRHIAQDCDWTLTRCCQIRVDDLHAEQDARVARQVLSPRLPRPCEGMMRCVLPPYLWSIVLTLSAIQVASVKNFQLEYVDDAASSGAQVVMQCGKVRRMAMFRWRGSCSCGVHRIPDFRGQLHCRPGQPLLTFAVFCDRVDPVLCLISPLVQCHEGNAHT